MIPESYWSWIPETFEGKTVGHFTTVANVGDKMIWFATGQLFERFGIDLITDPLRYDECDMFAHCGGGNMGDTCEQPVLDRAQLVSIANGRPIVVLPQTFRSGENFPASRTFVRENGSLSFCPSGVLAPDMALGMSVDGFRGDPEFEIGTFLRSDTESAFKSSEFNDPAKLCESHSDYIALASKYANIITDRLHFAIAGMLLGRRVTLLPNSYHKNRSMWEAWLRDLGCMWSDTPPTTSNRNLLSNLYPQVGTF